MTEIAITIANLREDVQGCRSGLNQVRSRIEATGLEIRTDGRGLDHAENLLADVDMQLAGIQAFVEALDPARRRRTADR